MFDFLGDYLGTLGIRKGLSIKEKIFLLSALAESMEMKMEYTQVFLYLEKVFKKKSNIVEEMKERFNKRGSWVDALDGIVDSRLLSALDTGQKSGNLKEAFEQVKKYYELHQSIRSKLWKSSSYFLFLLGFLLIMVYLMLLFGVPKFKLILKSMPPDVQLPAVTRTLITISDRLNENKLLVPASMLGIVVFLFVTVKQTTSYLPYIPGIKAIFNAQEFTAGLYLLAVLYESGVLVNRAIDDILSMFKGKFREVLERAKENIESGVPLPLSNALQEAGAKEEIAIIVGIGEQTQNLSYYLQKASAHVKTSLEKMVDRLVSLIGFLAPLFIALFIIGFYLATFLPMYSVIGQVH